MVTKIRKGNPKIADKVDTARTLESLDKGAPSSRQLRTRAAAASARSERANPNSSSYKAHIKTASDSRLQARFQDKPSIPKTGGEAPSPSDRRFTVTRDNRPEAKGNYSGVDVNHKQVRKGKIKAAERMVGKSLAKAAAKRAGPYVAAVAIGAEAGYAAGKAVRAVVDKREDKRISKLLSTTAKKMGK